MGLKNLLVVVPGIGGSVLETPGGDPVWGQGLRQTGRTVFRPSRLAWGQPVVPVDLLPTIGVLPWKKVPGYDRLVEKLKEELDLTDADVEVARPDRDPVRGASVVLFPYDFRAGMEANAERLANVVDARVPEDAGRRVIVVAHSMGGLVARWWYGPLGGHTKCRALVTVGTPHRGAPKALDWLLNGVHLGPGPISALTGRALGPASEVLSGWPSTYELLPRYPAVWQDGTGVYPHDVRLAPQAFQDRAKAAFGLHVQLEEACQPLADAPERAAVMTFFSRGHATPARAEVTGSRVVVTRADASWLPNAGWQGDGTVPAISALPIELADRTDGPSLRCPVGQPHLPMASAQKVVQYVKEFEAPSLAAVRGADEPDRPWVGFDTPEITAAGESTAVRVWLNGADPGRASARVQVLPEHGTRPGERFVMDRDEDGWQVVLPGLPPGAFSLHVALDGVPEWDRILGEDALAVLDPDERGEER